MYPFDRGHAHREKVGEVGADIEQIVLEDRNALAVCRRFLVIGLRRSTMVSMTLHPFLSYLLLVACALNTNCSNGSDTNMPGGEQCGGSMTQSQFDACTSAHDPGACVDAGGAWQVEQSDYLPITLRYCQCATGQGDCACDKNSQCLGSCVTALVNSGCAGVTQGHCTSTAGERGCYCLFSGEKGVAQGVCAD